MHEETSVDRTSPGGTTSESEVAGNITEAKRVTREFIGEEDEGALKPRLQKAYDKACQNKDVTEIRQVKNCLRNRPCPCGSGKKFKKCCIRLVNKGPQVVEQKAIDESRP